MYIWIEETISPDEILESDIKTARYNISKYGLSKYAGRTNTITETIEKTAAVKSKTIVKDNTISKTKYYMKSGLYVCTNEKIDFKKGKNDLYQYSAELTFREIK